MGFRAKSAGRVLEELSSLLSKHTQEILFLTRPQAAAVLAGSRRERTVEVEWALEQKLIVEVDSQFVPLATAEPQLLQEFEAEIRASHVLELSAN